MEKDFNLGYSPERINPGDKIHRLENITKVISADDTNTSISKKSIWKNNKKTSLSRVNKNKEAAKIIENTQRDINIAFVNELSVIFQIKDKYLRRFKAAETKWNFLKFEPGLVGGHCIGVDPYYLTYKAKQISYSPKKFYLRKLNDNMTKHLYLKFLNLLKKKNQNKKNILLLGITFKENCNDYRNSKPLEFYKLIKT